MKTEITENWKNFDRIQDGWVHLQRTNNKYFYCKTTDIITPVRKLTIFYSNTIFYFS